MNVKGLKSRAEPFSWRRCSRRASRTNLSAHDWSATMRALAVARVGWGCSRGPRVFMVSGLENKQSALVKKRRERDGEREIGNGDVIFKSHAFHISWFSFMSARGETHEANSSPNVHLSHIWARWNKGGDSGDSPCEDTDGAFKSWHCEADEMLEQCPVLALTGRYGFP